MALTKIVASRSGHRTTLIPFSGIVDDGSTLSLDFTTGVLDPRLTFTRASDATFINSSGLVQYADANWVRNSTMLVSTNWTATTVNGGTATINGDGSVTFASTAGRITWLQTLGLASGLPITFSIEVTALTAGDIRVSDLFAAGFGFGSQIYHYTSPSGVTQNNISSTAGLGTFGVGLYTVTATTTGTTNNIIFGTDCNGVNRTGSVTIRNPQLQYGTVVPRRVYVPNSSTSSAKWDSARFDYDPTTIGSPRGLLIEGSAVNLLSYSENFSVNTVGNWTGQTEINTTGTPAWTGFTAPDQQPTAHKIIPNTANLQHYLEHAATAITSGQTYTVSLFVKPDGYNFVGIALTGSQARATYQLVAPYTTTTYVGSEVPTITPYQNGWFRITLRWTASTTSSALRIYVQNAQQDPVTTFAGNNSGGIQAWGAQLETGSGASSYIPTGASQGQRVADSLTCTGANFSSWYQNATESSVLVESIVDQDATGFRRVFALTSSSNTTTGFPNWSGIVAGASSSRPSINANITANNQVDAYLALAAAVSNGQIFRLAFAAKAGDYRVSRVVSGTTYASTSTYNGYPANIGVAAGSGLYFVSDGAYFRALWLRAFKFYPFRITNAQMDSWAI